MQKAIIEDNFEESVTINQGSLYSHRYFILNCDVCKTEDLNTKLSEISGFNTGDLTIIISECLFVYLSKESTYLILQNFTQMFKDIVFLGYDLVGPEDSFGKEMIINLADRDIKLLGFEEVPDIYAQEERLLKCGFTEAEAVDMLTYYNKLMPQDERKRIEHLEFVDEFEEWNLIQSHSCFVYGSKLDDSSFEYIRDLLKLNK
jgi:hypothetical protein